MTAELLMERHLAARPERVWRALTDPAALAAWFWPPRLEPAAGGTELVLRHEGFADDATRDDHIQGWMDCLGRLPGWLASDRGQDPPGAGQDRHRARGR